MTIQKPEGPVFGCSLFWLAILAINKNPTRIQGIFKGVFVGRAKPRCSLHFSKSE
jgi:hypothetical protein